MSAYPALTTITHKLARLRRGVRRWLCVDGVSILVVTAVVLVFVSLGLDRFARLDLAQRAILLLLAVGVLVGLLLKRLLQPLRAMISDDGLCLAVESRHREAGQALISALQLSRTMPSDDWRISAAMVAMTLSAGEDAAAGMDFCDVLDRAGSRQAIVRAVVALALLACACVTVPATMDLWFQRNVLLRSVEWPRETTLRIVGAEGGVLSVPEGADLVVCVEADLNGVVPALVQLESRPLPSGPLTTESLTRVGENEFRLTFRRLDKPLALRAHGHDHTTDWVEVRLLERPEIRSLKLWATPPAYVGAERVALPEGQSVYRLLSGSALALTAVSQASLKRVDLLLGDKVVQTQDLDGATSFSLTVPAASLASGLYGLQVEDTIGVASRRPVRFAVRLQPDRKPDVRVQLKGIGDMALPRALIPLDCRFRDDYAVTEGWVWAQAGAADQQQGFEKRLPVTDLKPEPIRKDIRLTVPIDIQPWQLQADTHLMLRVAAKDNDTVSGPKEGQSGTISLRLVTEEEFRTELLRREQELRQEFERLVLDQKALHERCRILETRLRGKTVAADINGLAQAEKDQVLLGRRSTGLAEQFAQILAEVQNNRLEQTEKPIQERLQKRVIGPMRSLAQRWIPEAASQCRAARDQQAKPEERDAAMQEALATQVEILKRMEAIRRSMVKSETMQEAVNLLRRILKGQRGLQKATEQEQDRQASDIFEE